MNKKKNLLEQVAQRKTKVKVGRSHEDNADGIMKRFAFFGIFRGQLLLLEGIKKKSAATSHIKKDVGVSPRRKSGLVKTLKKKYIYEDGTRDSMFV